MQSQFNIFFTVTSLAAILKFFVIDTKFLTYKLHVQTSFVPILTLYPLLNYCGHFQPYLQFFKRIKMSTVRYNRNITHRFDENWAIVQMVVLCMVMPTIWLNGKFTQFVYFGLFLPQTLFAHFTMICYGSFFHGD